MQTILIVDDDKSSVFSEEDDGGKIRHPHGSKWQRGIEERVRRALRISSSWISRCRVEVESRY